ncbi:hypothetical protein ACFL4N_02500 [Thermodesulfobacteriota bacterium]
MRKVLVAVLTICVVLTLGGVNGWAVEEGLDKKGNATDAPEEAVEPESEKERPTVAADLGFYSAYIWRGFAFSNNSIVVQPSITAGYKGFSMNLWGNLDTDFDNGDPTIKNTKDWTETDLTLAYDRSFGPINVGVGYIYYALDAVPDSEEAFLSLGADVLLSPTITVYREFSHYPGWYLQFGVSHSFGFSNGWSLDLGASAGYWSYDDDSFRDIDDTGNPTGKTYRKFHDGVVSASLAIPVGKFFTISPVLAFSFPLSSAADNVIAAGSLDNKAEHVYGGISFSMAF